MKTRFRPAILVPVFVVLSLQFNTPTARAQSPVVKPRPLTIDLANPKAGVKDLSKEEKKTWRRIKKQNLKDLNAKNKYFDYKLDSAQLAYYKTYSKEKLGAIDTKKLSKASIKAVAGEEWNHYSKQLKSKYQIPDSIALKHAKDSSYMSPLSPAVQAQLKEELAQYTASYASEYTGLSADSLKQWVTSDSLRNTLSKDKLDSLAAAGALDSMDYAYSTPTYDDKAVSLIAQQGETQLSQYSGESGLAPMSQQEDMMFDSYEEMIQSEKYQKLMESMPGKKAEIESALNDPSDIDLEDLPMAENLFAGHQDKLAKAMTAKTVIKEKPSFMDLVRQFVNQDMDDVREETIIQRFSLSGYIQFSNYDPLFIDYSPCIAYAVTGKIQVGTGMTGRLKIGDGPDDDKDLFAYRGFVEYDVFNVFYIHGEYERTGLQQVDPSTTEAQRIWTDRWLLGLGKDIKLPGILNGSLLILYNFDPDLSNSPNPRRIQVRYGIKI